MPTRSGTSSSSMHTTASFSSSWIEGSPSRQSPTRNGVRTPRGSIIRDPYDSPSRQIQLDFNLRLSQSDRDFNEKLDQAAAERARLHNEQLAKAAKEHERVLKCAEREIERLALEEEQKKLQREIAQQREIERLQQEKARQEAEAQRQVLEAKRREEAIAQQAAEHQRKIQEAEARLKAQKDQAAAAAERVKKEQEDAVRKAQETAVAAAAAKAQEIEAAQAAQSKPVPAPSTTASQSTSASATPPGIEELHAKYIELHARMKEFRNSFQNKHKQKGDPLKEAVGDARRNVRKRLGQITIERKASVEAIARLREEGFNKALNTPGPTIDIRPFIISHEIPPLQNEAEAQYPAFLLYVWICFEKSVLKQFEKEAANEDGRIIQEIGLIAASLLADQRYMWKGIPLTDIVLAKLHRICPILFGIRGSMATAAGRLRLGWIDKQEPTAGSYNQRMIGIGAGFASLSLRQFSAKAPAVPMSEYWRAIVCICNTPSQDLWSGHFGVLKGLVRDYYRKFLMFYGAQGRAVLRRATIELPARAPQHCKEAAGLVSVYPDAWKKEKVVLV